MPDFLNDDIISAIFEHFDVDETDDLHLLVKRRALACSARVCRLFFTPAIRVLWRRLEDLFPLLFLLSAFIKVGESQSLGDLYVSAYLTRMVIDSRPAAS